MHSNVIAYHDLGPTAGMQGQLQRLSHWRQIFMM